VNANASKTDAHRRQKEKKMPNPNWYPPMPPKRPSSEVEKELAELREREQQLQHEYTEARAQERIRDLGQRAKGWAADCAGSQAWVKRAEGIAPDRTSSMWYEEYELCLPGGTEVKLSVRRHANTNPKAGT
jgi:hypothetical protein